MLKRGVRYFKGIKQEVPLKYVALKISDYNFNTRFKLMLVWINPGSEED